MGYHVHIRRLDASGVSTIALDEWIRFVDRSSRFSFLKPNGESPADQFARKIHAAYWHDDQSQSLGWSDHDIWTSSPSDAFIKEMLSIAPHFNAVVVGDEGELITPEDFSGDAGEGGSFKKKTRWEIDDWRVRVGLGLLFGLILVLIKELVVK